MRLSEISSTPAEIAFWGSFVESGAESGYLLICLLFSSRALILIRDDFGNAWRNLWLS